MAWSYTRLAAAGRARLVVETLGAMIAAAGSAGRVGIKISPAMQFNDCLDVAGLPTRDAIARV